MEYTGTIVSAPLRKGTGLIKYENEDKKIHIIQYDIVNERKNGRFFLTFDKVSFQISKSERDIEKPIAHNLKFVENQEFQKLKERLGGQYNISGTLICIFGNYFIKENSSNILFPTRFKPGEIAPEENSSVTALLIPKRAEEKIWDTLLYDLDIDDNFLKLISAASIQGVVKEIYPKYALITFINFPDYEGKLSTFYNPAIRVGDQVVVCVKEVNWDISVQLI